MQWFRWGLLAGRCIWRRMRSCLFRQLRCQCHRLLPCVLHVFFDRVLFDPVVGLLFACLVADHLSACLVVRLFGLVRRPRLELETFSRTIRLVVEHDAEPELLEGVLVARLARLVQMILEFALFPVQQFFGL